MCNKLYIEDHSLFWVKRKSFDFNLEDFIRMDDWNHQKECIEYFRNNGVLDDDMMAIRAKFNGVYTTLKSLDSKLSLEQLDSLCKELNISWTIEEEYCTPSTILCINLYGKSNTDAYTYKDLHLQLTLCKSIYEFAYREDYDIMTVILEHDMPMDEFTVLHEDAPYREMGVDELIGCHDEKVYSLYLNYFKTLDLDMVKEKYPEFKYYDQLKEVQKELQNN